MGHFDLNRLRRRLTKRAVKWIGNDIISDPFSDKSSIRTILVIRPNHRLGNQLLISPLLQELNFHFPHGKIDLFLKGKVGPILYHEYRNVENFYLLPKDHFQNLIQYFTCWKKLRNKRYDLVVNAVPNSSSGRLATKLSKSTYKIYGDEFNKNPFTHLAKTPVLNLRHFLDDCSPRPIPQLSLSLSQKDLEEAKLKINEIFNNQKPIISIFTYATGKKCYSDDWWLLFYNSLKQSLNHKYNILEILPMENISKIGFRAKNVYSRDLREIAALIQTSDVFIAADSGIMHLGCATSTPVIGLFSHTSIEKYSPYGASNIGIDTTQASLNDIFKKLNSILHRQSTLKEL